MAQIKILPKSKLANMMLDFTSQNWIALVDKCKAAGMEADEIMTATNKEGAVVILSAKNKSTLDKFIVLLKEIAKEKK